MSRAKRQALSAVDHLNLIMVTVPLIVDVESGVNDMLDRDGSGTPIQFHIITITTSIP